MIGAILAAAVLLAEVTPAVSPAVVTATPADQAKVAAKAKEDPERIVCKSEMVIGTRFPKKTCMTVRDREARALQDRQDLERSQGRNDISSH